MLPLAACQLIAGVDDITGVSRPVEAGSASNDAAGDGAPTCALSKPPKAPSFEDSDASAGVITLAMSEFTINGVAAYDLDDRCTGFDAAAPFSAPSCVAPNKLGYDRDLPGGGDDAVASALASALFNADLGQKATDEVNAGKSTNILSIAGYNGGSNVEHVQLKMSPSAGIFVCAGTACTHAKPSFDGGDVWSVVDNTPLSPANGYVVDDTLVVKADHLSFALIAGVVVLTDAVLTAKIDRSAGSIGLTDGIVAGRVPPDQVINAMRNVQTRGGIPNGQPFYVCENEKFYAVLQAAVCANRDLAPSSAEDNQGRPCEALSLAVGFKALPANADTSKAQPFPDNCADAAAGSRDVSCR